MNKRILFVDDEVNVLYAYKRNLRRYFDVTTASNALEAIDIIKQEEPFASVISDFRMPDMDGIELFHKVKEISPDTVRIMLTGFADLQIVIDAINEGNIFRFLTKPIQSDKLISSLNDALELHRIVTAEKELNRKLAEAYTTIKQDIEKAAELQRQFLPDSGKSIHKCSFDWIFLPSVFVSGDSFNYFPLDDKRIAFYIVDVSGHGLPAAFLSVSLSRTLSANYHNQLLFDYENGGGINPPSKVVKMLNEQFLSRGQSAEYFTMLYGIIDLENDIIKFTQAGHPSPIIIKSGGKAEFLHSKGFPVGILPGVDYFDQIVNFKIGDKFIIYTDGITECAGIKMKVQIQSQLLEFLNLNSMAQSNTVLKLLTQQLSKWSNGGDFLDDITMLIIERQ